MKEFLEKRWWQGVGGIVGIIALILVVLQYRGIVKISALVASIGFNIVFAITLVLVAIWAIKRKRKYEDTISHIKEFLKELDKSTEKFERKRIFLPDSNRMWELTIDSPLLTKLHGQAHALAINEYHDAKLSQLAIIAHPYFQLLGVSIVFSFYSRWADRLSIYGIRETRDMHALGSSEPAKDDMDRATFNELPWLKDPNWPQFLRKSCEKAGPLSPDKKTNYHLSAYARQELQWDVTFKDGVTGKEFGFSWDGKGEPIPEE